MPFIKRILNFSFLFLLFLSLSTIVFGQVDSLNSQNKSVQDILNEIKSEMNGAANFPDSILSPPTSAQQQLFDDSTMAMYQNALYAYYEYRVSGFKHRKEVFAWQLYSSKLIF